MLKLHILGTSGARKPTQGRHHTSLALEYRGRLCFFDVGEGSAHTAHSMGLDLLHTRQIVISHPHFDHYGGLPHFYWLMRRLNRRLNGSNPVDVDLYITDPAVWNAVMMFPDLKTEGPGVNFYAREYGDGLLFEEDGLRVTALHNHHLPHEEDEPWMSFGFLIEAEGKRIVYAGDNKGLDDYASLLPADLLLAETGHHTPVGVAKSLMERDLVPGKLAFIHHGRAFFEDFTNQNEEVTKLLGDRFIFCRDAQTLIL